MAMSVGSSLTIALRALSRNKLQTALTTVGMTIGVATVLTMIALGTGAEAAIEQQVRAAGMNLIVVTAGNYKTKTEDDGGGVVDHKARLGIENSEFVIENSRYEFRLLNSEFQIPASSTQRPAPDVGLAGF